MPRGKKRIRQLKKAVSSVNKVANALGVTNLSGSTGRKIGGSIGKKFGSRAVGEQVGQFIGRALGKGDYTVSANSLGKSSANLGAQVPSFGRIGESTVIEHREYVGDVVSSATPNTFNVVRYRFNPTDVNLFPWLSSVAGNYEQYEPLGAIVAFKSTSSDYNSSGQALGTVIIASDYDVYDANYGSKIEMENSTFAVSCKPSESMLHPIECDPSQRAVKLLYNGPASTPSDSRFHDLCNVQVATAGISAASVVLGELWITYKIRLHKPQTVTAKQSLGLSAPCDPSNVNWWGTITLDSSYVNNLYNVVTLYTHAAGQPAFQFNSPSTWGRIYQVNFRILFSGATVSGTNFTPTAGDSQTQIVSNYNQVSPIIPGTSYTCVASCVVIVRKSLVIATNPYLYFVLNYTASDVLTSCSVSLIELDPRQFTIPV